MISFLYKELVTLLRGFSQVFLVKNALSGALILAGLCCNSWQQALLALLGCLVSRSVASLWRDTAEEIEEGLYGFNGTLVGIAIGVFWEVSWVALLLLIVGAALSTWLERSFLRRGQIPGLTAPFILAVWLLLLVSLLHPQGFGRLVGAPALLEPQAWWAMLGVAFGESLGQVMLQPSLLAGILFLLALLYDSRRKALYALLGALLPMLVVPLVPEVVWWEGLLGYNAVLCAIYWSDSREQPLPRAVIAVVLSVALELLALRLGIVPLTAPFVLAVWIVWLATRRLERRR